MAPEDKPRRLLSIDGGGVKGIISLCVLKTIMDDINEERKKRGDGEQKPCDVFDMICGTSTGGLIAIMLGRLGYTSDEAISKYLELGKTIFGTRKFWWDAKYDHRVLEKCLKKVIQEAPVNLEHDPELRYKPNTQRRCKTFVVTTMITKDGTQPVVLRDYDTKSGDFKAFPGKIWEAGRSKSAAPTFFRSITLNTGDGPREYSDGGTIANNPIGEAISEACRLWKPNTIDLIVSLGAGPEAQHTIDASTNQLIGPNLAWWIKQFSKKWYFRVQLASYAVHAMTGTERLHHRAQAMVDAFQGPSAFVDGQPTHDPVYFRLNLSHKEAQVGLDEHEKMAKLKTLAEEYMRDDIIAKTYTKVIVARLLGPQGKFPRDSISDRLDVWAAQRLLDKNYDICMRIRPTDQSKANVVPRAVFVQYILTNVISKELAESTNQPIAIISEVDRPQLHKAEKHFGQYLRKSIRLDISVEDHAGDPKVIRDVIFYIAEDLRLPCDVVLGSETFGNELRDALPQKWFETNDQAQHTDAVVRLMPFDS